MNHARRRIGCSAALVLVPFLLVTAVGCGGDGGKFGSELTAADVVKKLEAHGLPIGVRTVYTAASDPNDLLGRPGEYTSKVNFRDTRIKNPPDPTDVDAGGSVEVFASSGAAKKRADYVQATTRGSYLFPDYGYRRDRVFLRLSSMLTPGQAKRYNAVLERLDGSP